MPENRLTLDSRFLFLFRSARRVSTPLIAVRTPDPAATISAILAQCAANGDAQAPVISWDCIRGFVGLTEFAKPALIRLAGNRPADTFKNLSEALTIIGKVPSSEPFLNSAIIFVHNAHRFLDPQTVQAIWNLRDVLPAKNATLVLLCPQITIPAEISHDVLVLDEPLPTNAELETIVKSTYADAASQLKLPQLTENIITSAVKAVSGLAAFPVAQSTAMSISSRGLNVEDLWERKRVSIEQTPGLSVWKGDEQLDQVKDCDNVVQFLKLYLPNVNGIVFIDEIEKAMAGAGGDTSGVSQEMHGTLLSYMQDQKAKGMLFIGHPGTGKSYVAKAAGRLAGIPTIRFDFSAMKHSHVGESNARLRQALAVVTAVCQGKALFIATTNDHNILSPELRRRFKQGSFFFDLPSKHGRADLWSLYTGLSGLKTASDPGFDSNGWTGSEIETCCELAHDLKISLADASKYIVPVSRSAPERILELQRQAEGRFISAAYSGLYDLNKPQEPSNVGRKYSIGEN